MKFNYDSKRGHDLHKVRNKEEFTQGFKSITGINVNDLINHYIESNVCRGILLVGSIPLGIGSAASDIDFIVLVEGKSKKLEKGDPKFGELRFSSNKDDLMISTAVLILAGIEVEVCFVSLERILSYYNRLEASSFVCRTSEIAILSRIENGWLLNNEDSSTKDVFKNFRYDLLNIRVATQYYIGAIKALEDARATMHESPGLSLFLGRKCVEESVKSYFASIGFSYLGTKWLKFYEKSKKDDFLIKSKNINLFDTGIKLMFPRYSESEQYLEQYLMDVERFMLATKDEIVKDMSYAIAFKMCPQITSIKTVDTVSI